MNPIVLQHSVRGQIGLLRASQPTYLEYWLTSTANTCVSMHVFNHSRCMSVCLSFFHVKFVKISPASSVRLKSKSGWWLQTRVVCLQDARNICRSCYSSRVLPVISARKKTCSDLITLALILQAYLVISSRASLARTAAAAAENLFANMSHEQKFAGVRRYKCTRCQFMHFKLTLIYSKLSTLPEHEANYCDLENDPQMRHGKKIITRY